MEPKLTEHQEKVLAAFDKKNSDVTVSLIYLRTYGHIEWQRAGMTTRKMQQKLGPTIKKLNDKLEGVEIVPGFLKNTYRLNTLTDEE